MDPDGAMAAIGYRAADFKSDSEAPLYIFV
jgi:hypothetical protein